jgi:hypothetical protein
MLTLHRFSPQNSASEAEGENQNVPAASQDFRTPTDAEGPIEAAAMTLAAEARSSRAISKGNEKCWN